MRWLFILVLGALLVLMHRHGAHAAAVEEESALVGGWVAGVQAWTFNKGTLQEALVATKKAGGSVLEVYLTGMKVGGTRPEAVLDEKLSDEEIAEVLRASQEAGVQIVNAYIGSKQWERIGLDEAELRKFFEFGRKLGLKGFTGEPAEWQWDMIEPLLQEYDMTFAIHNHMKGFEAPYLKDEYRYWDPRITAEKLKWRDPRFGICLDTGHAARSGLDVLAVARAIGGRCLSVHLKDVVAADPDGHDCVFGTGILDLRALLTEFKRQKLRGYLAVEYEWVTPHLAQDVRQCFEFLRHWETPVAPQAD